MDEPKGGGEPVIAAIEEKKSHKKDKKHSKKEKKDKKEKKHSKKDKKEKEKEERAEKERAEVAQATPLHSSRPSSRLSDLPQLSSQENKSLAKANQLPLMQIPGFSAPPAADQTYSRTFVSLRLVFARHDCAGLALT